MRITITDLELWLKIGVPDEERAREQRILVTLLLDCEEPQAAWTDKVEDTVNYEEIVRLVRKITQGEKKTLEKLGDDILDVILNMPSVHHATVEMKKFVFPETRSVSITLTRP